ncbi:MAG TPA: CheR family methyltransferase [Steroidobacteraceae bacterium]|nr:CheR family methyltransferase [Steroidobacteraceae bacterium]
MSNTLYKFVRSNLYYGLLLVPQGRRKHRELLSTSKRSDSHTYTSFYRSPLQLEALTGPVLDHLALPPAGALTINVFAGSNGSEAYTIASVLSSRRPELQFSIKASDLHQSMVDKANSGTYSLQEITQGLPVPQEFLDQTFDREGDQYVVKPAIRSRVRFVQADMLSPKLDQQFEPSDIVVAQNVLFHMPPEIARSAFRNVVRYLKPRSVLFLDGMELDMRVELTRAANLRPLRFKNRQIYDYSRRHIPENWWDFYYGNEPYFPFSAQKSYRYGTIFLRG